MADAIEMVMEDAESVDEMFMRSLVEGTLRHLPEIDAEIQKFLRGWELKRIANVDRAILRLAFYEIMFREDIPEKVVLNEAVELAKAYSDEQSYRFVNGVLSSFLQARQTDVSLTGGLNGQSRVRD